MTRRGMMATVFGVMAAKPVLGTILPNAAQHVAATTHTTLDKAPEGFEFTARLTPGSGIPGDGFYAIGQTMGLMIDPDKLPACAAGADALLGQDVRIILTKG
jgi:hypothetical protein